MCGAFVTKLRLPSPARRFVPSSLQVLFANVVAVGWNTYLSVASNRSVQPAAEPPAPVAAAKKKGKK